MDSLDRGYCLVLSGGGAKGVYHIGVWRALRELGIGVEAFIGASIGAIIASFLAQGSDEILEELGRTISADSILALPPEFTENGEVKLDLESLSAARELFDSIKKNRGLDTSPLRKLLAERLDEAALRRSGKTLGIVTVNLSHLEPREVLLEDMGDGTLVDYVMASAAFPGFERPTIAGEQYLDGGVHDNIPYSMARKLGYRRIIVSDISGAGRNRRPEISGCLTVYIKNSIEMGGVFDFSRPFLDAFTLLGYLDTMRVFGRLKGYAYFIEPNPEAEAAFARAAPETGPTPRAFPAKMRYDRDALLKRLECAAAILGIERIRAYSYDGLAAAIAEKRASDDEKLVAFLRGGGESERGVLASLREALSKKIFEESPYYYWNLIEESLPKAVGDVLQKALADLYPELPAGLIYLGPRARGP